IYKENGNAGKVPLSELYFKGHGAHAQNYHVFTPAKDKDWAMPWGNTPWIKEFPYANSACDYSFQSGESGRLQMEFYITPYDFASFDGPESSVASKLTENELIGLSWSMLDFDGQKCESFMNLSHDLKMINDASYLCAFRLMPLEEAFRKPIDANWKFRTENREQRIIRFYDTSEGEVARWHWDFGDGQSSEEQNPVHQYKQGKEWTVVLTVEGPAGKSVRSKVWDVVTK
ncbi:MAG TPA: PKD domain-containing protein, partial [Prolixibacteraceae bacterium]|nr:PKD domain-containing protein [Prolixibacteraceae bacterium]